MRAACNPANSKSARVMCLAVAACEARRVCGHFRPAAAGAALMPGWRGGRPKGPVCAPGAANSSEAAVRGSGATGGFTLLEVLIAMFIIMFGLLGIAALLPIASQDMSRAARADRAAAAGRSALAEVRVRQLCDPMGWLAVQSTAPLSFGPVVQMLPGLLALDARESYALDPLYLAYHADKQGAGQFPYNPDNPPAALAWEPPVNEPPVNERWTMQRITLDRAGPTLAAQQLLFDRIFTWQDDAVFGRPADPARRAAPVFNITPAGFAQAGKEEYLSYEGRFTWMATVCPAAAQEAIINNTPVLPMNRKQAYLVSVVVFDRRSFDPPGPSSDPNVPPAERWADVVDFPGGGLGGGDVVLEANDPAWLALREGEWLMLAGLERVPSPPAPQPYYRRVYRWYRILALGDIESNPPPPQRQVTLAGPDWIAAWTVNGRAKAALFNGVVGVYTETIEVER